VLGPFFVLRDGAERLFCVLLWPDSEAISVHMFFHVLLEHRGGR
jgi:hypothetical protein